jgi:DNA-directed RNA polymerase specialized sigma24 family protein
MEKDEKIAKIKRDLRQLRKITHSIEVAMKVKEGREKRLEVLRSAKPSDDTVCEIQKIEHTISSLHIEESIKRSTALETLYMDAINNLDPLDKTIILDAYINGKAYWKIGRDIGYTEIGVQKRIKRILENLASMI